MASIFFNNYHIEYSIADGRIHEFEKMNADGRYIMIDDESELIEVAKDIMDYQSKDGHGYSAFIYKLADDGKIKLPEIV